MLCCRNQPKILLFVIVAICFISNDIKAQTTYQLPPNQPEQDACNALVLCGNTFFTPYSYVDTGKVLDLGETPCSVNYGGEFNSVWFRVNINTGGKLVFKIIPVDSVNDYDFAVLNVTGIDCSDLKPENVVRCNFNVNTIGSNPKGIVGLNKNSNTPYIQVNTFGNSFCQAIDAIAGESYLIMIDNVLANENSGNGALSGFTIDFTGSTATFNNENIKPELSSITTSCNKSSVIINLSTQVLCNSIAPDGSDFTSNAPVKIVNAEGVNCSNDSGYTKSIMLNFSSYLPTGNFFIQAQRAADGSTLLSLCNNAIELPSKQIPFTISSAGIQATENKFICNNQLPYTWNGIIVSKAGNAVASYKSISSSGCDSTTILNLNVSDAPVETNLTKTICSYQSYTLPWDSTVNSAGTYTHTYIIKEGCDSLFELIVLKDSACKQFLYVPTAFTPNTDNNNDIFKPIVSGKLLQYSFMIYNRWGKMIFFAKEPLHGWDGAVDGLQQPAGTYVWLCNYQLAGEPLRTEKGTVTLIR
jgi:gliding motility-associated-like protein